MTYRSMECPFAHALRTPDPLFFRARNDGVTQAAHNGVLALALCMQWHWHECLSFLLLLSSVAHSIAPKSKSTGRLRSPTLKASSFDLAMADCSQVTTGNVRNDGEYAVAVRDFHPKCMFEHLQNEAILSRLPPKMKLGDMIRTQT